MRNILITGFKGNTNSSKILLDTIEKDNYIDKLYLDNDYKISEDQLIEKIKNKNIDTIFAFGQKPLIKKIYIESTGKNKNDYIKTNYDYEDIFQYLKQYFKVTISNNAGKYLCNNIYFKGLKYISVNNLDIKMIFIHIPYLKNIDIIKLSKIINIFLNK